MLSLKRSMRDLKVGDLITTSCVFGYVFKIMKLGPTSQLLAKLIIPKNNSYLTEDLWRLEKEECRLATNEEISDALTKLITD